MYYVLAKRDHCRGGSWCCGSSVVLFLPGSFLPVSGLTLKACIAVGFTGSAL